jgi:hypothetical protein
VDQLTWDAGVFGVDARAQDDDTHEAWLGVVGVDLGAEVVVPGAVPAAFGIALDELSDPAELERLRLCREAATQRTKDGSP